MGYRGFSIIVLLFTVCLQQVHINFQEYFYNDYRRETVFLHKILSQQKVYHQLAMDQLAQFKWYVGRLTPFISRCVKCVERDEMDRNVASERESSLSLFERGKDFFHEKNYIDSARTFEEFIKVYPHNPLVVESLFFLMECYFLIGGFRESLKIAEQLQEMYSHSQWARYGLLRMAQIYIYQGRQSEAIEIYQRILMDFSCGDLSCLLREAMKREGVE